MKIHSPLTSLSEVQILIDSGADVFYAGLESSCIFGDDAGIANRRPWKNANFNSRDELRQAIDLIHLQKKKIQFTINEHLYSDTQISKILNFISDFHDIDGFIVADLSLLTRIRKIDKKIKLIASTGFQILNNNLVDFYRNFKIDEMVLPRHLKINEIKEIVENNRDINFKCFIKNEDCSNIDGLCSYSHGLFKSENHSACELLNKFEVYGDNDKRMELVRNNFSLYNSIVFNDCGVCSIFELFRIGVKGVKIVGRINSLEKKKNDVLFVKKAIKKAASISNKNDFESFVLDQYKELYNRECSHKCFYK